MVFLTIFRAHFEHTQRRVVVFIDNSLNLFKLISLASAYPKPTKKLKHKTIRKKAFLDCILISYISRHD